MSVLKQQVSCLKGVGPKKQKYLEAAGIESLMDLLYYFPREYEDRTRSYPVAGLPHGERAGTRARVAGRASTKRIKKGYTITRIPISDGSGRGFAVWFNNPYTAKQLRENTLYDFYGRIDRRWGELQIQNPSVKAAGNTAEYRGGITPIYPRHGRLETRDFEKMISKALDIATGKVEDIFPEGFRRQYGLEEINLCLKNIHFPVNAESLEMARFRLAFEELFLLQLGLFIVKKQITGGRKGIMFAPVPEEERLVGLLPYTLTAAQVNAWNEVKRDMESGTVMNRLLQGDVGSGKTVIAALTLLKAAANGYQGALMVPTEILAEQHFKTISRMFSHFNTSVELLTGSCSAAQRSGIYHRIQNGQTDIVIGTHSLIQEGLGFSRLGVVITDEQHRFGVRQRSYLASKGGAPDVLVMTATPIPRSLALILYGDMDISVIDRMPPGRKRVETYVVGERARDRAYGFVLKQIKEGRQAYVVCPLIEESDSIDAVSAEEVYRDIIGKFFKGYRVALVHGRISGQDKERIMKDFRDGKIDILVSTTVIEVGVDVPNANIMVVENSERFGLAQLHQLRGRVGRGTHQSYCILLSGGGGKIARQRLRTMADCADGFIISERDLELRGPGDIFGIRQHGLPEIRIASLPRDMEILKIVQSAAQEAVNYPELFDDKKWNGLLERIDEFFGGRQITAGTI
jgi:ATP-dependent DNA helicase RecG